MIAAIYAVSGIALLAMGYAFAQEALSNTTQVVSIAAIVFVASAARELGLSHTRPLGAR